MSHPALSELIEHERSELMQIHAMVRCLNDVLMYADDDDSAMHADVALVIARLLNESVTRLEGVRMRVAQLEKAVEESAASAEKLPQVREMSVSYLVSPRRGDCPQLDDGPAPGWRASEPWLMLRDCSDVPRTGEHSCKPSSRNWVS